MPSTPLSDTLRSASMAGLACLSLCFVLPANAAEKSVVDKGEVLDQEELLALSRDRQGRRQPAQGSPALPHPFRQIPDR